MIPTDEDLNCLLDTWTAPPSPGTLEGRLRKAWRDQTRPHGRSWFRNLPRLAPPAGMFAGIAAGAVVCLLLIAEAFPQSLAGHSGADFPFTVDSEVIGHNPDGSSAVVESFTSAGGGLVLASEFPGDPLRTAERRILDPLNLILARIARPRQEGRLNALKERNPALAARLAEIQRTCREPGAPWTFAGNQTILNYATTGIQKVWMEEGKPVRFTQWSAPALHCAVLKSTTEKIFDGNYRLVFEQRALRVNMNTTAH